MVKQSEAGAESGGKQPAWCLTEKTFVPRFITLYMPDSFYLGDFPQDRVKLLHDHQRMAAASEHLPEMRTQGITIVREIVRQRQHFNVCHCDCAQSIFIPGNGIHSIRNNFSEFSLDFIKIGLGTKELHVQDEADQNINGNTRTKAENPEAKAVSDDYFDWNFRHFLWLFLSLIGIITGIVGPIIFGCF